MRIDGEEAVRMVSKYFIVIFIVVFSVNAKQLPDYIKKCHRYEGTSECIVKNIELLRPKLKDGIPELNFPSFNPLTVVEATLDTDRNFKAKFSNIKLYDLPNVKIVDMKWDLKKLEAYAKLHFDHIRITADYAVKGKLSIVEVDSKGPCQGNFTNVNGASVLKGEIIKKKNKEYIKWSDTSFELDLGKPVFYFDNIFGNNPELTAQTNKLLNENVDAVLTEFKPIVSKIITSTFLDLLHRVFGRFSFDELFLA